MKLGIKSKFLTLATSLVVAILAIAGVDRGGITFGLMAGPERNNVVVVDGIHFGTHSVTVIADGDIVGIDELAGGQPVAVYGLVHADGVTGKAALIVFDDLVDAPIDWIDAYAGDGLFTALGQRVIVTPDTAFAESLTPASIHGLQAGTHVEVSGFRTEQGIEATYIRQRPAGSVLEVTGVAQDVKTNNQTLYIGDLEVKYQEAEVVGFEDGHPADGQMVEARGLHVTGNGKLHATYLEEKSVQFGAAGTNIVLNGAVHGFQSANSVFLVSGTPVSLTDATQFEGVSREILANGRLLRVEGQFDDFGRVIAQRVQAFP